MIASFAGNHVQMERGEIFQRGIGDVLFSQVDRLDILMTFLAEIDATRPAFLVVKVLERGLSFIVAKGTETPFRPPLVSAKRAKERSFPGFSTEQA